MPETKLLKNKRNFFLRPLGIILIIAILFAGWGVWAFFDPNQKENYFTETVKTGNIVREVSVTGRVKPAQEVNLAFERSGKISTVNIQVGGKAVAGQILAFLENGELASQVSQAEASLQKEQIKLNELKIGARAEDLQIYRTKVENAQRSLADAQKNLTDVKAKAEVDLANLYDDSINILRDAFAKSEDALSEQIDELFSNDNTTSPALTFYTSTQSKNNAEEQRWKAGVELETFENEINSLQNTPSGIDPELILARSHLETIQNLFTTLIKAINYSGNLTQAVASSYRTSVNTARTNVNAALTDITNQQQAIATQKAANNSNATTAQTALSAAKNTLATSQDELALKIAGSSAEQIAAQEAQVRYALANVQNAKAQLEKTIIRSPIKGTTTKQDAKKGEIVSANSPLISVVSSQKFEIESNVPEVDIAKIKINNPAKITLDTFGSGVIFNAIVVSIDPGESLIEGVATYKVKLQFTDDETGIKPGMTANIDIETDKRTNVLLAPQRLIAQRSGNSIILIEKAPGEIEERVIEIGLKGSDGSTEVISGLKEGEKLAIKNKD
ncbi:MAG: Efflux transporter, RND family, MFP subunit [Parcubacteria group bacterium GW2011_GWA1_42_7]|nr:MAG: Efflux transporter, RND family, MFP subunit [Parcubacteria group bacterium GW2011_GWB1_42_6]KKS69295.1 MAG: Efflux transporter, RND family, MFP subunit [Parcubacteria group bacterium GW2011_GWA1_42_7]KKS92264.1 MAG: Efflux transporter, RND family, MFP subunit [Parcubacteria group bacterium GW2011_GWC1_43_12]